MGTYKISVQILLVIKCKQNGSHDLPKLYSTISPVELTRAERCAINELLIGHWLLHTRFDHSR